eukprot:366389-Chlamydomonas_euryale.AAC.5
MLSFEHSAFQLREDADDAPVYAVTTCTAISRASVSFHASHSICVRFRMTRLIMRQQDVKELQLHDKTFVDPRAVHLVIQCSSNSAN